MARNLYRFYLYLVYIAMLLFATFALSQLLQPLLALTPLRGDFQSAPDRSSLIQALVFALVTWVISGALGGLHYWLIRRDIQNERDAEGSAIRAFFLNITELIVAPVALGTFAFGFLSQLGREPGYDVTFSAAFSLAMLALFAWCEWERQRTQPDPGAARTFQQLHLFGVQLILLLLLTISWLNTVNRLFDAVVFGGAGIGFQPCGGFTGCTDVNLLSLGVATLSLVLAWIGYGLLVRQESPSLLRQILHVLGLASGIIFLLIGLTTVFDLLLKVSFRFPLAPSDIVNPPSMPDAASSLSLGLLICGVYLYWLRDAAHHIPDDREKIRLTAEAIGGVLLTLWLCWGSGFLLFNLLESLFPSGTLPTLPDWTIAGGASIAGLTCLPIGYHLYSKFRQNPALASSAWRGFLFALLGGGAVAGAIGGAIALFALGTSLLGSPLENWVQLARTGLVTFFIGIIVAGIAFLFAQQAQLFKRASTGQQPVPLSLHTFTVEETLDALLAHKISRDDAVAHIQSLLKQSEIQDTEREDENG